MKTCILWALRLVVVASAWPGGALAQIDPVAGSEGSCHAMLTAELSSGRARVDLNACGAHLVPAIAGAVRTLRAEPRDSRRTHRVLVYALNIRAPEIFNAALHLARDPSATVYARITGMTIVVAQHNNEVLIGGTRGFRSIYTVPVQERCAYDMVTGRSYRVAQPLAADYRERASGVLASIRATPQEDLRVRRLAACAERVLMRTPQR